MILVTTASDSQITRMEKVTRVAGPVALLVGFIAIVVAFMVTSREDQTSPIVTGNPAIEALIPPEGSEQLRQTRVGIDLVSGYDAELTINGVFIPIDQINVLRDLENPDLSAEVAATSSNTLSRFEYQPLQGRVIPELKADENCVVAEFWPLNDPLSRQSVSWCFTVA